MTETSTGCLSYDVIAVAASAGGLHALSAFLSQIPAGFPAALAVVQHMEPTRESHLAEILGRRTPLHVLQAEDGDQLTPGAVFIAPPDRHLLVLTGGFLRLTETARVRFVRPSADLLFESLAASYGNRAIAVVLSGSGRDASLGVVAIKNAGGMVFAQDPDSAEFAGMPQAAVKTGKVDHVLPLEAIGPALVRLVLCGGVNEAAGV
jgi:two-component system, chemotaxis family, protein-glutamate methylesterase/glutaminase